jgi:hypothetical protein
MRSSICSTGCRTMDTSRYSRTAIMEAGHLNSPVRWRPDWTHWTRSYALLESVRVKVGNQIEALGCSR